MKNYIQVIFDFVTQEKKDIIIALLSEMNYESFEEESDRLNAFRSSNNFQEKELEEFARKQNLSFTIQEIEEKNWNSEWESGYQPVIIGDFLSVRAQFLKPNKNTRYDLIITPKMSFGTGHHPTTLMMIQMMQKIGFAGKKVLDFGTGTGILAILAEKLGASKVVAIDNNDWSIENAKENIQINHCKNIFLIKSNSAKGNQQFDIILVNIHKSVIIADLSFLLDQLTLNGKIIFRGLLKEDEKEVLQATKKHGLVLAEKKEDKNWICLSMKYKANITDKLN
jgi:ribosomal protein L11 methyltransferase